MENNRKFIRVKCIKPTKTLEKNKEYCVEVIDVYQWVNNEYAQRYLVKANEYQTVCVSPSRFKVC